MRKMFFPMALAVGFLLFFSPVSSLPAQEKVENQFFKLHQKEMETFMDKCSGCHSLQRVFAKKRTREQWIKILNQMAKMPHAMISAEELKQIQRWIDLMESSMPPSP